MARLKRRGKVETFSVSVSAHTRARLRRAAERSFGGNVSALIEAIAVEADRSLACDATGGGAARYTRSMRRSLGRASVVVALLAGAGCTSPVHDVRDYLQSPLEPATPPVDAYEVGSTTQLVALGGDDKPAKGYHVVSLEPAIFATASPASPSEDRVDARALALGSATLTVVDDRDGHTVFEAVVDVREATSARIYSVNQLAVGVLPGAARASSVQMLVDDGAEFEVTLYDGDVPLRSNVSLRTTSSSPCATATSEGGAWLNVTASCVGAADVIVSLTGRTLATLHVDILPSSAVASIELVSPNEHGASAGTKLELGALALDAAARPIESTAYAWTSTGLATVPPAPGAQFAYTYDPSESLLVEASLPGVTATTTVHGHPYRPPATGDLVCSVVGHGGPAAAVALALSLAFARRARRRPRP